MSALLACFSFSSCQELDGPADTDPTVTTLEASEIGGRKAYFTGVVNAKATGYFLLSQTANLTDPIKIEAEQLYTDGTSTSTDANGYFGAQYNELTPGTTYYFAFCASDGTSEVMGNVKSFTTPTFLNIANVYLTDIDGYSTNTYTPEESLGIYLLSNWTSTYNVWNSYTNIKAEYSNSEYVLPQDISLSSDVRVYAYHPYTTECSNYSIPVKANESYYGVTTPTYLYGNSGTLNSESTDANVTMHYALCKVTLAIKNANGNDGSTLTNVTLSDLDGDCLASSGNMNVFTGTISNLQDFVDHSKTCSQTLTSTASNIDFMLIPTSFASNQMMVTLTVDGKTINTTLPSATWSKASHYTYSLSVDKGSLKFNGVRVEQWNNQNGGTIDINQN